MRPFLDPMFLQVTAELAKRRLNRLVVLRNVSNPSGPTHSRGTYYRIAPGSRYQGLAFLVRSARNIGLTRATGSVNPMSQPGLIVTRSLSSPPAGPCGQEAANRGGSSQESNRPATDPSGLAIRRWRTSPALSTSTVSRVRLRRRSSPTKALSASQRPRAPTTSITSMTSTVTALLRIPVGRSQPRGPEVLNLDVFVRKALSSLRRGTRKQGDASSADSNHDRRASFFPFIVLEGHMRPHHRSGHQLCWLPAGPRPCSAARRWLAEHEELGNPARTADKVLFKALNSLPIAW